MHTNPSFIMSVPIYPVFETKFLLQGIGPAGWRRRRRKQKEKRWAGKKGKTESGKFRRP